MNSKHGHLLSVGLAAAIFGRITEISDEHGYVLFKPDGIENSVFTVNPEIIEIHGEPQAAAENDAEGEIRATVALIEFHERGIALLESLSKNRERALAITKAQETVFWLRQDIFNRAPDAPAPPRTRTAPPETKQLDAVRVDDNGKVIGSQPVFQTNIEAIGALGFPNLPIGNPPFEQSDAAQGITQMGGQHREEPPEQHEEPEHPEADAKEPHLTRAQKKAAAKALEAEKPAE